MSFVATSAVLPAWVGTPPEDWSTNWLKWHVALSTIRPSDDEAEQLPYISNEDIESWTGRMLNADPQPVEADGRRFWSGDVLFNKLRPYLAKVYHAPFDGVSSGELLCLRPSAEVLPRFLFYVASSKAFVDAVNAETFGSKMPRADWEIVGHQPLPLPPLETQKLIADFLDDKTAQIDALIARKQALLARLAEKRQAIITQAVTKGLNRAAPLKDSGIDWLGQIPAHWEVKPLRWYIRIRSGEALRNEDMSVELTEANAIPVIGGNGLMGYTSDANSDDISIIVGRVGALCGNVHPVRTESWITDNALGISRVRDFDLGYLTLQLKVRDLNTLATRNAQPLMTGEIVKAQRLGYPPIEEQQEIATHFEIESRRIDEIEGKVFKSVGHLQEYRAALITSAVTGQTKGLQ